ncbi:MAG: DinB family protein [Gemmatimonadota bacterium]
MRQLADILKQDAADMYRVTEALFGLVDDIDWKPVTGENWMTTGQLLRHCGDACGTALCGFITGDWRMPDGQDLDDLPPEDQMPSAEDLPAVESVDEARRILADDRELSMKLLSDVDDERLLGERSAPPWGGPERTLFQHCNEMIWHLGQHKGQLFYYLKLQGKPVNTYHLWMGGEPENPA